MTALTNTAIEALQPGARLKDDRVHGLEVRRHGSGVSFLLYYRTKQGDVHRPKIGDYPALSIAQAREIARGTLAQVASGRDPVAERTATRHEPTVQALYDRCMREHYNVGTVWGYNVKWLYNRHIGPRFANKRVRALDYNDIAGMMTALKDKPVEANRALAVVSKMLKLAERWGMRDVNSNPCRVVARYPERKRRRYAKPDEIAIIGPILDRHAQDPESLAAVAFTYLMIFSGARPSEIGRASPSQVERVGAKGVLRLDNGKTGQRDVFLPPQAMAVLDKLPTDRKSLAGRTTVPHKFWGKLRAEAGCPDLWFRDWRRTFGTTALTNGVTLGQVGELLGHASVQTTKIYAKLIEDGAHTAAATTAGRLEQLLGGNHAIYTDDGLVADGERGSGG